MTMSFEASRIQTPERAQSLARRVLGGAGSAGLFAYRLGESLPFVAHGLAADGSLVIAARPEGLLSATAPGFGIDVRMDVVLHSADPTVSIVAASVHLLGELTWVGDAELRRLRETGLPSMLADLADEPGMQVGVIEIERAVLHDLDGATVVDLDELGIASAVDDLAAQGAVARLGQDALKDLCWAVMVGRLAGQVRVADAPPAACAHTEGRVFCVDADLGGVTLMLVSPGEAQVVYAAFPHPVASAAALDGALAGLVEAAAADLAA